MCGSHPGLVLDPFHTAAPVFWCQSDLGRASLAAAPPALECFTFSKRCMTLEAQGLNISSKIQAGFKKNMAKKAPLHLSSPLFLFPSTN